MCGELVGYGIDLFKDVQFVNIFNFFDYVVVFLCGEVELICLVEFFVLQICMIGVGKYFVYLYDQVVGCLINLIVICLDVIKEYLVEVKEIVVVVVRLVDGLQKDKQGWINSIVKGIGFDFKIVIEVFNNVYFDYCMYCM